jgi:Universal stress protein UspA and related nucleotide-binding proteins
VAGTHSRGGVARLLLGSVAGELIRRPPCDVLVVP